MYFVPCLVCLNSTCFRHGPSILQVLGAKFFGMEFRDRVDNRACIRRSGPFVRGAHGQAVLTTSAPFGMELQHGDLGPRCVGRALDSFIPYELML